MHFAQPSVEYLGQCTLSKDGVAKGSKVDVRMPPPTDVGMLISFTGSVQLYAKFLLPYLSTITEPLHELTKKEKQWKWDKGEQEAFERLKDLLCTDNVRLTMTRVWNWASLEMHQKLELVLYFFTAIPMSVRDQLPTSQRH